jgi:hypothetical protein
VQVQDKEEEEDEGEEQGGSGSLTPTGYALIVITEPGRGFR